VELADVIVVNKADGDLADAAQRAASDLRHAVRLLRPKRAGWEVDVLTASALTGARVPELWEAIESAHDRLGPELEAQRARQSVAWMWSEVTDTLLDRLRRDPGVRAQLTALERKVAAGELPAATAAQQLLHTFLD
jgi:LAO/AO transport system kinase